MKTFFKKKFVKLFLFWRVWLIAPIIVAIAFLPIREGSEFAVFSGHIFDYSEIKNSAIFPWANFDGIHYLSIAARGYIEEGRFLPVYPILIKIVELPFALFFDSKLISPLFFWIGLTLSNIFFILSLVFLNKLLKLDFSEKMVDKVLLMLVFFPTSFFFVSVYTESLFLLLSVLTLYYSRKREWAKVIIFSATLSITRLPGILILIPVLYEFIVYELEIVEKLGYRLLSSGKNNLKKKVSIVLTILLKNWLKFFKFLIIPVPLFLFAFFNYFKWSDPFYFVNAHASLGNSREVSSLVFPLITIYRYIKIFLSVSIFQYEFWVALLEFISLVFAIVGIFFATFKKIRTSYSLFAIALVSLPLLSGTLTGFPRYLVLAFPIFIGFASKFENESRRTQILWKIFLTISIMLQFLLLMFFSRGWFIA